MSQVVKLSTRDWFGIVASVAVLLGGFWSLMGAQQARINELAVSQATTTAHLEATARMQDMILTRLERVENK